jgi:RHS repeat-associated protein
LQGDVIAIVDKDAQTVARYSYDAWGAVTSAVTNTELTKGVDIAAINPFRYLCYYYDEEIKLYYLSNRYYSSYIGRFDNCDSPEMVGLSTISYCVKNSNLSIYCLNNPTNDSDVVGCISANQIANMFSISTLFALFMPILYASYPKGLVAVGAYATKIVTPIAVKAFWWKPWAAAAIIIAAVAIIVAAVGIYFSKQAKKSGKERANNPPSWVPSAMNAMPPHWGEKAKDYARRLMDSKCGRGNWKSGPNTEYNKIVKYLTRHLGMP